MTCYAQTAEGATRGTPITVHLASGRSLSAAIELGDDPGQLWLRWQRGRAVLLRPVAWESVVRAEVGGEQLDGPQLRRLVDQLRAEQPPEDAAGKTPTRVTRPKQIGTTAPAVLEPDEPEPRVCSLSVDAYTANFDADVEADGLIVEVAALDGYGRAVPVHGTLQIELIGQPASLAIGRRETFQRLGYWSRRLQPEDFGPYGATLRLPFTGVHPEFDTDVAPTAAVHVTLSVPGQGSFQSTDSMVRVRPYSSVRDRLQQRTGRRFFPQERTGDGRR